MLNFLDSKLLHSISRYNDENIYVHTVERHIRRRSIERETGRETEQDDNRIFVRAAAVP